MHINSKQIIAASALVVCFSALCAGQGNSTLGISADITGGGNGPNVAGQDLSQSPKNFVSFVGTNPSVNLAAHGERSTFETSYGFGINENYSTPRFRSKSHVASAAFSTAAGPNWKFNLTDSFAVTSDISTFNLLHGISPVPEEFRFVFNPVVAHSSRSNTASFGLDYVINGNSTVTFGGSHSVLAYIGDPQFSGILSDQQRFSARINYAHSQEHGSWSIGYSGAQFAFNDFQNSRSHSITVGYSHQFSPVLEVSLDGGPSYLDSPEYVKHHIGSNASFALHRKVNRGSFSLTYSQSSGDTSGLGSVSGNQQVGIGLNHPFGQKTTWSVDVSGFDTKGRAVSTLSTRGISAGSTVGIAISRRWSMNWGGQYQRYLGNSLFGFEQKRVFASLRFHNPELWRF